MDSSVFGHLITFIEEILNGKLHLCAVFVLKILLLMQLEIKIWKIITVLYGWKSRHLDSILKKSRLW